MLDFLNEWKEPPNHPVRMSVDLAAPVEIPKTVMDEIRAGSVDIHSENHLNEFGENIEMHDSALFDAAPVTVIFHDGSRLTIPQETTPQGWVCPF